MKILYVGTERDEAQAIATAVSGLTDRVSVSWTSGLDQVAKWLDENHGVRALVVEAQPNGAVWRSVLTYAAKLPAALPVVVIEPEGAAPQLQPLALVAQECIARNASLLRDLPAAITRAIDRARRCQPSQQTSSPPRLVRLPDRTAPDVEHNSPPTASGAVHEQGHRLEQLEKLVELEREARADLEQKLVRATASIQEAEHRHRAAMAAGAQQLAIGHSHYELGMARAAATRDMVDEQFREAAIEVERVRRSHASAVADAERLARRDAELSALLDAATTMRDVFEHRLADAETALRASEARTAEELRTVAERIAERQREFQRRISEEIDKRRAVQDALVHALGASDAAEERHASAMIAAAAQSRELRAALSAARQELEPKAAHLAVLVTREAELTSMLAAATTSRETIERRLAVTEAALREADARATRDLLAAGKQAAAREEELEEQIRQQRAARTTLEEEIAEAAAALDETRREHRSAAADVARLTERETGLTSGLADARAALRDEQQRHDAALATAAGELAERRAHFDHERAQAEGERAGLTAQLREVEEARDQARREHQSAVADLTRLTEREAELEGRLKEGRATRDALQQAVADTAAALRDEQQRHDAALATAAGELTEAVRASSDAAARAAAEREATAACQADLEARLSRADETIDGLQQALAETRSAALDAERLLNEETNALRADALVQAAQFSDRFDEQRRQHESRRAEAEDINNTLARERVALQESLHTTQKESHRLDEEHRAECERLEQAHTAANAAIQQLTADRHEIERRFEEARSGFQDSLGRLTREHAAALATRENDIEQLRNSLTARLEELEVIRRQREVLQADADRLPRLHQELHQSRADNHRLFQQAQLPMFRCTKDGALTQANRLLTIFVGRRSPNELREADFAAAVFESPNDLSWLIERCLGSRGKEWIETTWRRKDGSRLLVRLSACATSSDLIECGVEDLTPVRVLTDRLSQAHRMEAVGRLAAEVAVTCGNLLRGIHENAQQWLMTDDSQTASRRRGEMLLEEVSRAGGLLRQLAAYGDEENRRPAVVELNTVVRDIAPVLKRVAGDAVDVQFPAASAPLNVDAGAERVQRLLVNLAAYGRERMPFGGRLKIELGTIVVDRHFTAKHPHVRLGPHALVTVTESRRTTRPDGLLQPHDNEAGPGSQGSVAVQTRVDVGTLQELVGECGGHLWMTVQPLGDMVVKIRLPLLTSYGQPPQRTLAAGGRARTIAHWFQHRGRSDANSMGKVARIDRA